MARIARAPGEMRHPQEGTDAMDPYETAMRQLVANVHKRKWMMSKIREVLPPTPVETMGCKFLVHPNDNRTEWVMWWKGHPPEVRPTSTMGKMLAGRDAVIVDVGANAGAVGLPILKAAGPASKLVQFECNPVMLARLRHNISLNDFADRVTVIPKAVSDREGVSTMHFPANINLGQGRVDVPYEGEGTSEGVEVELVRLPETLAAEGVEQIDLLKVDVEGLEDRVIVPLLEDAPHLHPEILFFEVSHGENWSYPLMDVLERHGYEQARRFAMNSLFVKKKDG